MIKASPKFKTTKSIETELKKIPHLGLEISSRSKNLYSHTALLLGALNRTYELTHSAIWAIDNNRPQTTVNMLRGLIETLGLTHYVWGNIRKDDKSGLSNKIDKLLLGSRNDKTSYQSINVLTLIDGATKAFPKLRQSYDDLSEMVHPNGMSFLYSFKAVGDESKGTVEFRIPFYEFKVDDKQKSINQVGECCYYIQVLCREIIDTLNLKKTGI